MPNADERRALDALPPRNVRALLEQLAALRQRQGVGEATEAPLVTLHLRGGQSFTGWVLALGEAARREERGALLLSPYDTGSRAAAPDALYLEADQIVAVRVLDAARAIALLVPEWSGPPPGAAVPTRLEVRRRAAAYSARIGEQSGLTVAYEVDWETVPGGDTAIYGLLEAMGSVTAALTSTLGDDLARQALSAVRAVRFSGAAATGVALVSDALLVRCALADGTGGRWSAGEWETAIATIL